MELNSSTVLLGGLGRKKEERDLCSLFLLWSLFWLSTWCLGQWQTQSTLNCGFTRHARSTLIIQVGFKILFKNPSNFCFYKESICKNLTAPENEDINSKVQKQVNDYQLYSRYMEIPQSIVSLFLGPLSGTQTYHNFTFVKVDWLKTRQGKKTIDGVSFFWPHIVWNFDASECVLWRLGCQTAVVVKYVYILWRLHPS